MAYQYDVFISYKNQPGLVTWVKDHFQPLLQTWLDNELPQPAAIFRDKVSIEAGDQWSKAIKEALGGSRVIIAVLTPQYFTSKWCVAEWQSFEKRELLRADTANKLLIPVKYSNGPHFPVCASNRQFTDATDFLGVNGTVIPPQSIEAAALETKVKLLAKLIADRLLLTPTHKVFPIVDPNKVKLPKLPTPNRTKPIP